MRAAQGTPREPHHRAAPGESQRGASRGTGPAEELELHALGEALGGTEPQTLAMFVDTVNAWLSAGLAQARQERQEQRGRMARIADAWQQVNAAATDAEMFNLERKPLVFNVFGRLAEAARG